MVVLLIILIVLIAVLIAVGIWILYELLLVQKSQKKIEGKLSTLETKLSHISHDTEKLINWKVMD